jgi:hypothetical protein
MPTTSRTLASPAFWSPRGDHDARRLWSAGFSAPEIARRIGAPSASAVVSRAWRQGWVRRRTVAALNHRFGHPPCAFEIKPLPPDPPLGIAVSPRPWLERNAGQCAFPVDGEGWLVRSCCNPSGEAAYCAAHRAIMRGPRVGSADQLAKALERYLR